MVYDGKSQATMDDLGVPPFQETPVYICIYPYIYIYTYTYIYKVCIYIYTYVHIHIYIDMSVCMYVYIYIYSTDMLIAMDFTRGGLAAHSAGASQSCGTAPWRLWKLVG